MRIKIEKERKKKSLLQQIQNEISRIKGVEKDQEEEEECRSIIDDETPPWLKMVIHSQHKDLKKDMNKESLILEKSYTTDLSMSHVDSSSEADTPSWIKIFQERSEKLKKMQQQQQSTVIKERTVNVEINDENLSDDTTDKLTSIPKAIKNLILNGPARRGPTLKH